MQVEKPVQEFSLTRRDVYDNQFKLERLELINTIQHFVISMLDISKEKKLELVYLLAEKLYPIKTICRVLGMKTSTFYHDKNKKPEVYIIDEIDDEFKPLIQSIFNESDGRFGGRKIPIQLVKVGILPTLNINNYCLIIRLLNQSLLEEAVWIMFLSNPFSVL